MRKRVRKRHVAFDRGTASPAVSDRRLIVVDQEVLRDRVSSKCRAILKKLEQARRDWARFTEEDQPAFTRWTAATFGPLLTAHRELSEKIRDRISLVRDIDFEFFRGKGSRHAAYSEVIRRRNAPPEAFEEHPENSESAEDPHDLSEEEKGAFFDEFLEDIGLDPRMLPPGVYASMRAEFEQNVFGEDEPPPKPPPRHRDPPPVAQSLSARIKEKYRWLARQLHPDTTRKPRPDLLAIWHEVQEAYQAGNLEQLETLVAVVEMREGIIGEQTSLSQARAALGKMQTGLNALGKSLKHAKKDNAWLFSQAGESERKAIAIKIEPRMREEIDQATSELAELDEMLRIWAIPPPASRKRQVKTKKRSSPSKRGQPSFEF